MPSPFPGMDPYLEASGRWLGFHNAFITYCSEWLNARLPEHYVASIDERVELLDASEAQGRSVRPDVAVVENRTSPRGQIPPGGAAATLEPETLTLPHFIEVPDAFIEIIALPGREVVTSIEVLSPTNKTGFGLGEYMAKRRAMVRRGVNLVEVDLLLGGERPETVEPLPRGDYFAFVSRAARRPQCEVYWWPLRHVLPVIPIPLREPDPDVSLDLAAVFARTYDHGGYGRTLRYDGPAPENVPPPDRDWVAQIAARLR